MRTVAAFLMLATGAYAEAPAGVVSEQRAQMNWMLNCQGCHQPDGSGSAGGAPSMENEVAKFLSVEGGREYLTRVPGVAFAGISNDQLAELLNWTLATFDRTHMPADFAAFTADEMAAGRAKPLISEAPIMRAALRKKFSVGRGKADGE